MACDGRWKYIYSEMNGFEELYDLYGDKMRMHPLVRIPMRTCFMVYMVHLTNQMAMKAPVPNIQEILKQNPDIARQCQMQSAASSQKGEGQEPVEGLMNFSPVVSAW